MLLTGIPYKFQYVWGQNATGGFVTNPIPATTVSGIAASQSLGFPPATAEPTGSGGTPPDIDDFNGGFNYATAWLQWLQAGGPVQYDAALQTNINGYPSGAMVRSVTYVGKSWISTTDNNITNPDASGAGWQQVGAAGYQEWATPGTYNFTVPPNVFTISSELWGGGGGSGGAASVGASGGGSGAGYSAKSIAVTPGQVIPVSVGSGGAGGAGAGPNAGNTGVSSAVGSPVIHAATGGNGGNAGNASGGEGGIIPGVGTGGDENYSGEVGGNGVPGASTAPWGGAGGGAWKSPGGVAGGVSATPSSPSFPGAGARGTATIDGTPYDGAAGANGKVIFRWEIGR